MEREAKQNRKLHKLKKEQNSNPQIQQSGHKFYPRVENLTNIQFNQNEMVLLNKGLKDDIKNNTKNNIIKLALDVDCAIQKYIKDRQYASLRTLGMHNSTK
ncbi:hypothetical protein Zmor_006251 [Zophobas morio]|uniref:Uncharacterized protein n=1 Tax=Zophobas morio TaxID=2755281 RepID=A0AA38IPQ2_9CUCU|nr:hypothetical protein Zmor_021484 [Zophobas morio]KAJ3661873.1 hypothetical protein Zmor_006251 [Zophobas morio]